MTQAPENDDKDQDTKPLKLPKWLRPWVMGGLAAFAAWGALVAVIGVAGWGIDRFGQWGDSFAPLTGIASTLALVMTTWSVSMQRRELALQREELRLTREEMAAQRAEMIAQRKAQEDSAAAQTAANRIANLANAIAIHDSIQGCYSMTIAAEAAPAVLHKAIQGKDVHMPSVEGNSGAVMATALETVRALKALEGQLEKRAP